MEWKDLRALQGCPATVARVAGTLGPDRQVPQEIQEDQDRRVCLDRMVSLEHRAEVDPEEEAHLAHLVHRGNLGLQEGRAPPPALGSRDSPDLQDDPEILACRALRA